MSPLVSTCLDVLQKISNFNLENNLSLLSYLLPDDLSIDELYQNIILPLKGGVPSNKENNISIQHNLYRTAAQSSVFYTYIPDRMDELVLPLDLRELELQANEVFDSYCKQYYRDGVSSCYFWKNNNSTLNGCILLRKELKNDNFLKSGFLNSIHMVKIELKNSCLNYKLESNLFINFDVECKVDKINFCGWVWRYKEDINILSKNTTNLNFDHIKTFGKMIEDIENDIRSNLEILYLRKCKEVLNSIWIETNDNRSSKTNRDNIVTLNEAIQSQRGSLF